MSEKDDLLMKLIALEGLELIVKSRGTVPSWRLKGVMLEYLQKKGLIEGAGSDSRGDEYIKLTQAGREFYDRYS